MLRSITSMFRQRHPATDEEIVRSYGAILQRHDVGPFNSVDASALPYRKEAIKSALIACANAEGVSAEERNALSVSFIFLADFVENLPARISVGQLQLAQEINDESQQLWVEWQDKVGDNA